MSSEVSAPPRSLRNRLRHFIGDGVWASVCEGLAETNFIAFGTMLSASAGQLSLLASYQALSGCVLQLWSEKLVGFFRSRKRLVVTIVSLQSSILVLMAYAALTRASVAAFFILALLFSGLGSLGGATWNSWISDLLPARRRGFCFASRNRRTLPANFAATLIGGTILHEFGGRWGFFAIFCFAFLAKMTSARHLWRQPHFFPAIDSTIPRQQGPIDLISRCLRDEAVRRMLCFFGMLGFSVGLSAAFTTPYLLKELKLGYFAATLCTATMIAARFIAAPYIGARLDRDGARSLLALASLFMPLSIAGWALANGLTMVLVTQVVAGVIWAAFDLSSFAFIAENSPSSERTAVFAARQVTWALAMCLGAATGAAIGSALPLGSAAILIFWLSAAGRALASLVLVTVPKDVELLAGQR